MPKKMRRGALRSALSEELREQQLLSKISTNPSKDFCKRDD